MKPIGDYLVGLRLLEDVADDVEVLITGHGSVCGADQVRARIEPDRAHVKASRDGHEVLLMLGVSRTFRAIG